jgi:histidinol phosphatase-like enzyme (inositol monophosphatase family)
MGETVLAEEFTRQLAEYLEFARKVTREAGQVTLKYYRRELAIEEKADLSPVTIADRETEQFIRAAIRARYPEHGILGEEFGEENPGAPWRWIIDPIDGTQAFVHGVPLYTVLLALEFEGDSHLGVIHNPPQDETVAAATGLGCTYNGKPCRVSQTASLDKAWVHVTDYADLLRRRPKFCDALLSQAGFSRTWADAYGYLMVATGRADIMLDPIMSLWDSASLKPILLEAGGRFTDLEGNPTIHATNSLATNGLLHEQMLELARLDKMV